MVTTFTLQPLLGHRWPVLRPFSLGARALCRRQRRTVLNHDHFCRIAVLVERRPVNSPSPRNRRCWECAHLLPVKEWVEEGGGMEAGKKKQKKRERERETGKKRCRKGKVSAPLQPCVWWPTPPPHPLLFACEGETGAYNLLELICRLFFSFCRHVASV